MLCHSITQVVRGRQFIVQWQETK